MIQEHSLASVGVSSHIVGEKQYDSRSSSLQNGNQSIQERGHVFFNSKVQEQSKAQDSLNIVSVLMASS